MLSIRRELRGQCSSSRFLNPKVQTLQQRQCTETLLVDKFFVLAIWVNARNLEIEFNFKPNSFLGINYKLNQNWRLKKLNVV
nr:hypothetical protein Itr_chr01CG13030 [Ipomoea trifida]GMD22599.1 hypothetical protein Iba_chr08aCG12320 [Ipomoea batatas]